MCTLTYIPQKEGFIFTHNRDERMDRATSDKIQTTKSKRNSNTIYFPQDLEAKGTWIAFSENNTAACLLNGGSLPYNRKDSYRKSRGLVVLESFDFKTPYSFYTDYDFEDLETFTLIIKNQKGLFKIVHDEYSTVYSELNVDETHIWSSTTLYAEEIRNKREVWFQNWLESDIPKTKENIKIFHQNGGDGNIENDLVMSRWGLLKTVSISQIAQKENTTDINYWDFVKDKNDKVELKQTDVV